MLQILAIAKAIEAACNFACTPEGQAILKQWREDGAAFRGAVKQIADWFDARIKEIG